MRNIAESSTKPDRVVHLLEGGGEVHVHENGDAWLYPQARCFICLDDALAFVA